MNFNLEWLLSTDYSESENFGSIFTVLLGVIFFRYLALALIFHEIVYKKVGDFFPFRRLHEQVKLPQVRKEIWYSFLGAIVFSFAGTVMLILWQKGFTKIYTQLSLMDIFWIPVSFFLALFIHETYYYWLHRWMHHPKVLPHFHHIHHTSIHTSSFTSFSFHPLEAVLQSIFLPVLVLILPMHFLVLFALLITMSLTAVINHSGVEVYPRNRMRSLIFRWLVGATHHDSHHLKYRCNYGLYFTFWDIWMKTEEAGFEKRYEEHTSSMRKLKSK